LLSQDRRAPAGAFVRAVIDLARAEGFGHAWLVTNKANAAAVAVYTRLDGQAHRDVDVVYRWTLT
jgi:hypothetical protein